MARGFPKRLVEDLRRVHLLVDARKLSTHIGGQRLEHAPALTVPEDDTRALFLEMEQVHFTAQLAVVALFGFRQDVQIVVELLLIRPGRTVDAGQHRIVAVPAPIGAGHLHQLEGRADLAGRCHVRTTAEVEPVALEIDLEVLVGRDRVDQFDLVGLALAGKDITSLVARPDLLGERLVALDDFLHPLFDLRQILGREGPVLAGVGMDTLEVVVEAVFDHRTDGHLGTGPQFLHRLGHDMGRVVADEFQRTGVLPGDDLDRTGFDRIGKVAQGAVERDGECLLGQRLGNCFGNLVAGRARGVIADGTVGECEGNGF